MRAKPKTVILGVLGAWVLYATALQAEVCSENLELTGSVKGAPVTRVVNSIKSPIGSLSSTVRVTRVRFQDIRRAAGYIDLSPGPSPYWRKLGFFVLVAINSGAIVAQMYYQHSQRLKAKRLALEAFSRRLMESQEAERKRIASELHDSLGQNLMVIKNQALMALREDPSTVRDHLTEISATASQAIAEVRTIAYGLRPYQLDRLGLTRAVESLVKRTSESSGIGFSTRLDPVDSLFDQESKTSIYRILQEGVNNVVRHSAARKASVEMFHEAQTLSIKITDDGIGFNFDPDHAGLGLLGIQERVLLLGGTSQIVSAPGAGTSITISIGCNGGKHER